MRTSCQDFIVGCCEQANWVGYGRGLELLYEFIDAQHRLLDSNQELIDFLNWRFCVDTGEMPERLGSQELVGFYAKEAMWSDDDVLAVLCEYIDELEGHGDVQQALMGFFRDIVDSHGTYSDDEQEFEEEEEFEDEEDW